MKTSDLTGAALDWAVAKCEGVIVSQSKGGWPVFVSKDYADLCGDTYGTYTSFRPSTNWSQGGPIIEREKIDLMYVAKDNDWIASRTMPWHHGLTPLIAAMRCYVASKLGDEVEIPKELK